MRKLILLPIFVLILSNFALAIAVDQGVIFSNIYTYEVDTPIDDGDLQTATITDDEFFLNEIPFPDSSLKSSFNTNRPNGGPEPPIPEFSSVGIIVSIALIFISLFIIIRRIKNE